MDQDRVEGPVKEAGGKVKEEWGDLTDDSATEAEGKAEQAEGKLQNEWGEAKDTVRDVVDDDRTSPNSPDHHEPRSIRRTGLVATRQPQDRPR